MRKTIIGPIPTPLKRTGLGADADVTLTSSMWKENKGAVSLNGLK